MKKIGLMILLLASFASARVDADGSCCGCGAFDIGVDYLYWKAHQDDIEYAIIAEPPITARSFSALGPHFKARSGVRIFADYAFCDCAWRFGVIYTHFDGRGHNSRNLPAGTITELVSENFPVFRFNELFAFTNLNSNWRDHVNMLDLDIAREFCPCSCLAITPHIGLRGLWIRQKFTINGVGPFGEVGTATFQARFREHFDGYGVEAGLHGRLCIGCNFSLLGHLGTSLLYARIKNSESFIRTAVLTLRSDGKYAIHHLCPTFDAFFGIGYQRTCYCYPIELHLGWEKHLFMDVSHFSWIDFASLTLQGLTVGGSVRF